MGYGVWCMGYGVWGVWGIVCSYCVLSVIVKIAFYGIDKVFFRWSAHKIYHVIHKVSWCSGYHISLTPKRSRVRSPPRSKRRYRYGNAKTFFRSRSHRTLRTCTVFIVADTRTPPSERFLTTGCCYILYVCVCSSYRKYPCNMYVRIIYHMTFMKRTA